MITVILSCSTKKNTFSRRAYHNLTSHYNVYWNGRESLWEGADIMRTKAKDNYTKVLPVFNYGKDGDAQQIFPQMDRAIKKGSIAIQKHSMEFGGEEKVKWIDDCYMMIGEAYFYKKEYISARRTFNFVIREYGENDIKYDAMLWLAQTYNQLEEFEKSEPLLNLVSKDVEEEDVPLETVKKLPQIYADHYILQEKYDLAVDHLYEALSYNPPRLLKIRMLFILGQIFQGNEDLNRATDLYRQVIRKNPPYEMAFQAKINMAKSYDASTGDSRQVIKYLTRMLKDDKNKDYLDQIYFALAEVALKDNDMDLAIEYLGLSVLKSTNNNYQKSASSLKLADIYFEIPEYELSQAYYDTTMMFLPKDYPDYKSIEAKTSVLSELVIYLITVQHQDSLQRLSRMSEDERSRIIDKIIEDYILEQERLEREKELQEALNAQDELNAKAGSGPVGPGTPIGGGGAWYFYNSSTKNFGHSEFIKKWGKRKQEDLWRLSNKQLSTFGFGDEEGIAVDSLQTGTDTLVMGADDPLSREYYLKDIPFTDAQIAKSDTSIKEALFQLGRLYKDGLNDLGESRESFETLLERFPANDHQLQTYYYLYKIYEELGDFEQQEYYKNLITTMYPGSDYAKVLNDPEYFKKLSEETNKVNKLYEETYEAYEAGQYYMVIAKSEIALTMYGDTNALAPKFEFLKAMSVGRVDVLDSLVASLKHIILQYPDSEVKTMSQNILAHIMLEHPEFADENFAAPNQEPVKIFPYKLNNNRMHMFIMVVKSREVRLNPLKVKISDYNTKYYSLENLTINSLVLDNTHYLITVGNFTNAVKALKYNAAISQSEYVNSDLKQEHHKNFIISTENYPVFFKEKNIEEYEEFYNENYKDLK